MSRATLIRALAVLLAAILASCSAQSFWQCGRDTGTSIPIPMPSVSAEAKLLQVQIAFRHGDRTVANTGPCWMNDTAVYHCQLTLVSAISLAKDQTSLPPTRVFRERPMDNRNSFPGTCFTGQLTDKGYLQEVGNGLDFAQAYRSQSPLVSGTYKASDVWLRSDDEPRTISSLQAVTNAMFPPSTSSQVEVVDFHSMDTNTDDIQPNPLMCPDLNTLLAVATSSSEFMKHYNSITLPLLKQIAAFTGLNITLSPLTASDTVGDFLDCMTVHLCQNYSMPAWFSPSFYNLTFTEYTYLFNFPLLYNRTWASQIGIGFLLADMWASMPRSTNTTGYHKMLLWSGHDDTLQSLELALLGGTVPGYTWPPYASRMIFEVWSISGDLFVRVLFESVPIQVPGCSAVLCPLAEWEALLTPLFGNTQLCPGGPNLLRRGRKWLL